MIRPHEMPVWRTTAIFERMTENDWAPFRNPAPDPWPKVALLLRAA